MIKEYHVLIRFNHDRVIIIIMDNKFVMKKGCIQCRMFSRRYPNCF